MKSNPLVSQLDRLPATPFGLGLLVGSLFLLITGLSSANAFGLTLGVLGFLLLVLGYALAFVQYKQLKNGELIWKVSKKLQSGGWSRDLFLDWRGSGAWPIFSLQYQLRGSLRTQVSELLTIHRRGSFTDKGRAKVSFFSPFSGELDLTCHTYIADFFGLIRIPLVAEKTRSLTVYPRSLGSGHKNQTVLSEGEESQNRHKEAEEERYLMREYVAGDRVRDINWKSSMRTGQWITRISPEKRKKSLELHLVLTLGTGHRSYQSMAHLEALKGWFMGFLSAVFREANVRSIRVYHGTKTWDLKEDQDLEAFGASLATMEMESDTPAVPRDITTLLVFSTPFDRSWHALLAENPQRQLLFWRTRPSDDEGVQFPEFWIPPAGHRLFLGLRTAKTEYLPAPSRPQVQRVGELPVVFSYDLQDQLQGGHR